MARDTRRKWLDLLFLEMTRSAGKRGHGSSRRLCMTSRTIGRQPSAAPVTLIAGELRVFSQQWPRVIELFSRRHLGRLRQRRFLADDCVAKLAVLAQHFAFPADVISFVTAKATRIEGMADVVAMGAPINFHFRKDIGLINLLHLSYGLSNCVPLRLINFLILLQVECIELGCNAFSGGLLARIVLAQ